MNDELHDDVPPVMGRSKSALLLWALSIALRYLPEDFAKQLLDDLIDKLEDALEGRPLALSAIGYIRQALDIPDDIGGDPN